MIGAVNLENGRNTKEELAVGETPLIKDYDLEVFTPPCEPGAERFAARARLKVDITEVLPYLNATLRGAVYNPAAPALTWKKGGHNIAFHPFEIATSDVEDREKAEQEVRGLVELVNRTWARRAEIEPSHEVRQRPTPMAVYQLLPRTNCGQCGEATCFTFALKLVAAQVSLEDCPPMGEPRYRPQAQQLAALLPDAPSIGRRG